MGRDDLNVRLLNLRRGSPEVCAPDSFYPCYRGGDHFIGAGDEYVVLTSDEDVRFYEFEHFPSCPDRPLPPPVGGFELLAKLGREFSSFGWQQAEAIVYGWYRPAQPYPVDEWIEHERKRGFPGLMTHREVFEAALNRLSEGERALVDVSTITAIRSCPFSTDPNDYEFYAIDPCMEAFKAHLVVLLAGDRLDVETRRQLDEAWNAAASKR